MSTGDYPPRSDRACDAPGAAGPAHFADQLPRQRPVHQPDRASGCGARHTDNEEKVRGSLKDSFDTADTNLFKLGAENIFLGRKAATKEEAIRFAGEQLVKGGYVEPEYVQAMLDREN